MLRARKRELGRLLGASRANPQIGQGMASAERTADAKQTRWNALGNARGHWLEC